jgi:hypothetical protein
LGAVLLEERGVEGDAACDLEFGGCAVLVADLWEGFLLLDRGSLPPENGEVWSLNGEHDMKWNGL